MYARIRQENENPVKASKLDLNWKRIEVIGYNSLGVSI
jgi:hypothetical protein